MKKKNLSEKKVNSKEPVSSALACKPSVSMKKGGNEIDEIFASKKRKKPEQKKSDIVEGKQSGKPKLILEKKKRKQIDDSERSASKPRRKTGDGFTLYTEEELGLGKENAGGTQLCPFDCDCCF